MYLFLKVKVPNYKKEDKENAGDSKVASQKGVADFLSRQQKAKNMQ